MNTITSRKLNRRSGAEGPAHDPYGFTEYVVEINGDVIVAHRGLVSWLKVTPRGAVRPRLVMRQDESSIQRGFEIMTGIALRDFDRYYDRAHPESDFEDPMGPASRYI